jgi:CBS domain containing-hemolysin-like protein
MRKIKQNGFSRVPVVEGGKIIGILMAKSCLGVDLHEEKTLS